MRIEDIVGLAEIAELLNTPRNTVDQWRRRGILPDPLTTVSGNPVWAWPDVEAWALETGRMK